MTKYRQKDIRNLVKQGIAIDITEKPCKNAIPERYKLIGWSEGMYGTNAKLYKGESGQLYAVTKATMTMYPGPMYRW